MLLKEIYIDVETTGLDKQNSAIWELSGTILIGGVQQEEFDYYIAPHKDAKIDLKAIQMSNLTLDEMGEFTPANQAFLHFKALLEKHVSPFKKTDKFVFKAYNAPFDSDFIRSYFKHNGSNYYGSYFHTPAYDVMVMAMAALENVRHELPDFKLSTVARYLGVSVDDTQLHNAKYDIDITIAVDRKVREMLKNG